MMLVLNCPTRTGEIRKYVRSSHVEPAKMPPVDMWRAVNWGKSGTPNSNSASDPRVVCNLKVRTRAFD